jgi:Domain of unknown function (DUF4157)
MSQQRWIRGGDERAFDWYQPASALGVPLELARELYLRAIRRAEDAQRAEALYLRWLDDAAAALRPAAPPSVPGRKTRAMHDGGPGRPRGLEQLGPGKWTRALLATDDEAQLPGADEVQLTIAALTASAARPSQGTPAGAPATAPDAAGRASGVQPGADARPASTAELRARLMAAAANGHGAAAALAAADPEIAATALRELRALGAPILSLVARAADGEVERVLSRGSSPAALPADVGPRLVPHVGAAAVGAARLHTDDAADLIASAHHAHAVTLGIDIFFARGAYAPGTEHGDGLLAHELTHVAQGQRGELGRAAAKGLDSGNTLDPAEAEAELRAKLAVIALHPPKATAPQLAAPSGQPTSPGDRQAKLSAQRQRLSAATQPTAQLTIPPAPPALRPQAPVPHPAPQLARPPAAPATTGNAYVDTFAAPPSRQALELWATAGGKATTQAAADQAKFNAGLPPIPVVLDGREQPGAKGGGAPAGRGSTSAPTSGATPPAARPTPTPRPPAVTTATTAARAMQPTADLAKVKADGKQVLSNLPTSSPEVKTDPGPAPVTDLAGQADPMRTVGDQQHAIAEGAKALDTAKAKVVSGPGAAQVQPAKLDEKLLVPKEQPVGNLAALPTVEGMAKLNKWQLPTNALGSFDELARPRMQASLAQAQAKMAEAEHKRDADRTKAVADTETKVKQAHVDADKQQQAKVAQARTQITNHQSDSLVKHETEIKKLDQQSGSKKAAVVGKINTRVQGDQAKVEADYQNVQDQAEAKRKQGEADAAKKKKEAEAKKQDESWWNQAADAICDGIKAIAEEIDHALEAIGKAIGELIDAVKNAACTLIDAARDFVCQALTEFGDWLKSAVTALLGSVFPELAAALNRLIDAAVNAAKTAVNAIADGLKQAVTALCDSLKASLDAAIAAFRAGVQVAATLAQALVTGDWQLVAKMVLEGILRLLGIDPGAFYALIGKAQDSIEKIIENPGAFVGHLIDAVKLGFKQFGQNFWNHLKSGVVQWLFGTFAEAGITMPAKFDVAGIFDLVCQVLGLTWPRLRGKVVKVIGEKNTERLELVAKYLEALVTGGFAGLWEQVQQDLSGLWDMVVGGVKDWLLEKLVQQAIIKIATMWNPAGAIIQLIQTAWNVYQWVRENAQRIFGLVQAIVDSMANIVAGNITGAANFIEASLAKLVPIAISLFANLLGLGGIADKIKGIITKIQSKVDQAIDKLIERVTKLFKGKDKAADAKPGDAKPGDAKPGDAKPGDAATEPDVPRSMVEPVTATVEGLSPAVSLAIDEAPAGATRAIYQAPNTDPKTVTKNLLASHADAKLDKTSAQLTLPPVVPGALAQAQSLPALGRLLAQQTGVSTVELHRTDEGHAEIVGAINPRATFAQLAVNKRFNDAKRHYAVGTPNEAFAIDDITIAGATVQGLKTTLGLEATQARRYLDEWVRTGKVREITSPVPPTKVYAFKPSPTPADLLVPRAHPEYPSFKAGCAAIPLPAADADRDWDLLITGLRDNKPANFELVAASLMRNMSIPAGKGALWSGGEDLSDYARTQGCTALEQQDFYKATKGLELVNNWSVARKAWAAFSRLYASQLRGKIHVYMRRFAPGSVLVDIELKKIDDMLAAPGGVPGGIHLRYHAMEWGDDPHQHLDQPLPGYWRELNPAGNPLGAGVALEQDQGPAAHAVGVAEARFRAAQAAKP